MMSEKYKFQSPWTSIWIHPRETVAQISGKSSRRSLWILASIYGFCSLLNGFQLVSLHSAVLILIGILLAPLWGHILFAFGSLLLLWTGKWFSGEGTFQTIRTAYAWSSLPLAFNIPIWLVKYILYPQEQFFIFPEKYLLSQTEVIVLIFIFLVKITASMWSWTIYCIALAKVQNFTLLRAILNILAANVIIVILTAPIWIPFFLKWH